MNPIVARAADALGFGGQAYGTVENTAKPPTGIGRFQPLPVIAMPGQVDYVAANAFLDALATARARDGLPWVSIGWDAWREVGMAARTADPHVDGPLAEVRAQLMRDGLATDEGLGVLARVFGSRSAHLVVSTHPLTARLAVRGARQDRIEAEDASFFERVRAAYLDIAVREPGRVRVVDATRPEAEVAASVAALLDAAFEKDSR